MPLGADRLATAQYEPCVHGVGALMPVLAQNDETGHTVATELAAGQYVVGWHGTWVAEIEAAEQTYPALHWPVGALSPAVAQNAPGVHGANEERPVVLQNEPIGLGTLLDSKGAGQ